MMARRRRTENSVTIPIAQKQLMSHSKNSGLLQWLKMCTNRWKVSPDEVVHQIFGIIMEIIMDVCEVVRESWCPECLWSGCMPLWWCPSQTMLVSLNIEATLHILRPFWTDLYGEPSPRSRLQWILSQWCHYDAPRVDQRVARRL